MKQQLSPVVIVVVIVLVIVVLAAAWWFVYGKPKPSQSQRQDQFKGMEVPPEIMGVPAPSAPAGGTAPAPGGK